MRITDAKSFGAMLKTRRKQLGYTQAYISEMTGLSVSFLSELENGKKTAQLEKAIEVAMLLGLNLTMEARGKA
ncbi:MAG: helix-turn-helix domain-containing protein [Lachnospiraceae bacterium]|nr:helix-turn-helix domain-containing protein [Lachnospiraceae bacterium]